MVSSFQKVTIVRGIKTITDTVQYSDITITVLMEPYN